MNDRRRNKSPFRGEETGILFPGNIDLMHRPIVETPEGPATVRSITITNDNGNAVLIPTVSAKGYIMSNEEAIQHFRETGQQLGVFKNEKMANRYAEHLHRAQERLLAVRDAYQKTILNGTR